MYIDLGGSHAHKGEGTAPNDLVTSLMETRHPLDAKMKQSQVALFRVTSICIDCTMYNVPFISKHGVIVARVKYC